MRRTALKIVSLCLLSVFACGCVTRTSLRRNAQKSKDAYEPVKPSSLSQYMRAVYQLSSEAGNKQTEERNALLLQNPELRELETRIEQDSADIEARSQLVTAYLDHQLYWAAYELLTNAEAASPNAPDIHLNLARIWDQWGQYDLALQYAARSLDYGAPAASAYDVIGRIHLHRKSPAEAVSWFNRAAEQKASAEVFSNLGYAHILLSDWEQARVTLEKAIELDSNIAEVHNNLAVVLTKLGDERGALAHLAKTARPAAAFNNMGVLYLQEGRFERAQVFFEASLRLDPGYQTAQRNLQAAKDVTAPPSIIHLPSFSSPAKNATAGTTIDCLAGFAAKDISPVAAEPVPIPLVADAGEAVPAVDTAPALTDRDPLHPATKLEPPAVIDGAYSASAPPAPAPVPVSEVHAVAAEPAGSTKHEPEQATSPDKSQNRRSVAAVPNQPDAQKDINTDPAAAVPELDGAVCATKGGHVKTTNSRSILSLNRRYFPIAGVAGFLLVASSIAWRSRRTTY